MRAGSCLALAATCVAASILSAQVNPMTIVEGRWRGTIEAGGTTLPFAIRVIEQSGVLDGTIDIQGASGLPLKGVDVTSAVIHFELPAVLGVATFEGTIAGDSITGTFAQGNVHGVFHLQRDQPQMDAAGAPPPYPVEDVTFSNGGVRLAGTVTMPSGTGPFPAVVMVTGSGAQTRDEELFGFKLFAVVADHLARQGVATLRYDDRGVGGSTGDQSSSTLADYTGDALAGIALLASYRAIDRSRIGIFGHSEGGIVASMGAARSSDVAFVVMAAAPAIRGEEVLARQQAEGARQLGADSTAIAEEQSAFRHVAAAIRSNAGSAVLRAAVVNLLAAQYGARSDDARAVLGDKSTFIERALPGALRQFQSAEVRELLALDPASILERVPCPVLALFGGKDVQVPVDVNRPALETALAKSPSVRLTVKVYPDANHLFIRANTGQVSEYESLAKVFVPTFLDDIAAWVKTTRQR